MIEMSIDSIRVSMMNYQRVVILKEKSSDRYLPIWIGPAEADAIAIKLQGVNPPRPLTHDLVDSIIRNLGASVSSIVVSDLHNDTFYAKLILDVNGKRLELDSRPSDAMAIAIRAQAPIYAAETVLDRAGIIVDSETGKPSTQSKDTKSGTTEEELKSLSAFRDFVDSLNLEDLGKGQG
ncbi:MAG: bifunctional nuclease family protein [Dehalococcoidia bacterium]|nr:bifunctional nuclease family protein [Dehalococcoidia bacterium]